MTVPSLVLFNALKESLGAELGSKSSVATSSRSTEQPALTSWLSVRNFLAHNGIDPMTSLARRAEFFGVRPETGSVKDATSVLEGGEAEALQNCGNLQISGGSLNFGDVRVNTSVSQTFTIRNPNCCPVNYTIAGGAYGFSLSSSGGTIPANGSVSVTVTFTPYNAQYYSGTASVSPGGAGVTMNGRGVS